MGYGGATTLARLEEGKGEEKGGVAATRVKVVAGRHSLGSSMS